MDLLGSCYIRAQTQKGAQTQKQWLTLPSTSRTDEVRLLLQSARTIPFLLSLARRSRTLDRPIELLPPRAVDAPPVSGASFVSLPLLPVTNQTQQIKQEAPDKLQPLSLYRSLFSRSKIVLRFRSWRGIIQPAILAVRAVSIFWFNDAALLRDSIPSFVYDVLVLSFAGLFSFFLHPVRGLPQACRRRDRRVPDWVWWQPHQGRRRDRPRESRGAGERPQGKGAWMGYGGYPMSPLWSNILIWS